MIYSLKIDNFSLWFSYKVYWAFLLQKDLMNYQNYTLFKKKKLVSTPVNVKISDSGLIIFLSLGMYLLETVISQPL